MRRSKLGMALVAMCLAWWPTTSSAQDNRPESGDRMPWRVGFGRAEITPDRPVWMSGYRSRDKPSEGVECPIYVKAMALEDADVGRAVVVTADLTFIRSFLTDPVVEALGEDLDLGRDQFLFTCAHNHSSPTISLDAEARDDMSKAEAEDTVRYTREVQGKLIGAIRDAFDDLGPARMSWGVGVAPFVMNRREFTPEGVILGHNPRGLADRSVPVLRVEGPGGRLRGVVFGCAVHNTTLTQRNYAISGDYAGFAQRDLEERHPGAQAMFVTGCAGDADPYPRGTMELAKDHGRTLGVEVARVLESDLQPVEGPLRVALGSAELPFQSDLTREALEAITTDRQTRLAPTARALLGRLDRGEPLLTHQPAPVSVWQFGDGLTLVALSGEVVVDYVPLIEKTLGPLDLWIAAYAHEVFGYVTSARVQAEGGYEAMGIAGKGLFAPETQDA